MLYAPHASTAHPVYGDSVQRSRTSRMQRLGMLTIPGSCHPVRCLTPQWSHPLDVPSVVYGLHHTTHHPTPWDTPMWCVAMVVYGLALET